jgi:hypothetical protein
VAPFEEAKSYTGKVMERAIEALLKHKECTELFGNA